MLNIYTGGETIEKEKFLFSQIKGRTLLLVPDQFSLQAERDAFFYLEKKSLMDVSVVDFSALGRKVLREAGGRVPPLIDKYGRHMLLSRIIEQEGDKLRIYGRLRDKNSFVELVNGLISEMKRFEVSPERLEEIRTELNQSSFLAVKLADIVELYRRYEEEISGKYLDSEDYITFYGDKILKSRMVASSDVWVYGFDTFTPKNLQVLERILRTARSLNIIMTYEDGGQEDMAEMFSLTGYGIKKLRDMAENSGQEVRVEAITSPLRTSVWSREPLPVILACTSDVYAEAERAASYIMDLVRDEGYRFRDIVVVCNDTGLRMGVLRRTFMRWGIPVFLDKKRQVLHHPAISFLLTLLDIAAFGYRDDAVMRLIKSGLLGFAEEESEALENYAEKFRIRGGRWRQEFTRTGEVYSAEELVRLNEMRCEILRLVETVREQMGRNNTAGEKIRGLYRFLEEDFSMPEKIEAMMQEQQSEGLREGAAETAQSWNILCGIFDQVVETIGDEKISAKALLRVMEAGFAEVEIGIVPANPDSVLIGTVQRSRLSRIKALLVLGANEGLLPLEVQDEGLLSAREKELLESMDLELAGNENVLRQEEKLAIYRTLSQPSDRLYVSCSRTDEAGGELRPSAVFQDLEQRIIADGGAVLGDLDEERELSRRIGSPLGSVPHMTDAFRRYLDTGRIDDFWIHMAEWYAKHEPGELRRIQQGMDFDNTQEALGDKLADALYRGERQEIAVSASRLERYSACPFAHFIGYGLRPDEARVFEMGAREIGDIYHECIMKLSQRLTGGSDLHSGSSQGRGDLVSSPDSRWMTISREECRREIEDILEQEAASYREGLLRSGQNEAYRTGRIAEICTQAAWAMIGQVRRGAISSMYFEQPFARGSALKPIRVPVGDKDVVIQGKIDRLDVLETGGGQAVRIIDYKTGGDDVNAEYFRSGYKLQLMIYLRAAMQGRDTRPAGVFLFKIREMDADADVKNVKPGEEAMQERSEDYYRLEGIVLDDPELIDAMDGEMEGASRVIPVKRLKKDDNYAPSAGGTLFTEEEFRELSEQVDRQVQRICSEIADGRIDIRPKKENRRDMEGNLRTSCRYCDYRSICMFDTSFPGCRYERV